MKKYELQPGILYIFRLFVWFRTGLLLLQAFGYFIFGKDIQLSTITIWFYPLVFLETFLLLGYLYWPLLQDKLGKLYLPIALLITSFGPILESFLLQRSVDLHTFPALAEPFIYLFIPLVLIAWQYRFKDVITYTFCMAVFETAMLFVLNTGDLMTIARVGLMIFRTVTFFIVGYMINELVKVQRNQQEELSAANLELAQANMRLVQHAETIEQLSTSRERNRLARELHDTLAHTLSGLAVQLDAVTSVWDQNNEKARNMVNKALLVTRSGLDDTRRALQDLRATSLEELGLSLSVKLLAEDMAERLDLELMLDIPGQMNELSPDIEQGLYRITQEALLNIQKHASAAQVKVVLKQTNGSIYLSIWDNGKGFLMEEVNDQKQFGLQGMRERASLMNAEFKVRSEPQVFTEIIVRLEHKA